MEPGIEVGLHFSGVSDQTLLAKGLSRSTWEIVLGWLHHLQFGSAGIPRYTRLAITGKASMTIFHAKLRIFREVWAFQTVDYHLNWR